MGELINLNPSTPIADADLPASIARDLEFQVADKAHVDDTNPHDQYLPKNLTHIEFGVGESANYLDFHVGPLSATDFDCRLMATNGIGQNGRGSLSVQAEVFNVIAKLSVNGGVGLTRFLANTITVDLPSVPAGGVQAIDRVINGAVAGDIAIVVPIEMPAGLIYFKIDSVIVSANLARIYFYNIASVAIDLAGFAAKLIVISF